MEVRVLVQSLSDTCLTGECLPVTLIDETSLPPIILFQALPKGAKLDLIVRQAAEGGIAEIRPFVSDYSIPKGSATAAAGRVERWRRIIKEARQQSGSSVATDISAPCTVEALLDYWETVKGRSSRPLGIIFHQAPAGPECPLAKSGFHDYLNSNPDLVGLAIGPEGGFSPEEVSRFLAAGFKPLIMGNTILRTETAALYAAAAVRIILLENTAWTLTSLKR
jgi:16S rRNA (uracil1498-N3)-methyltransferase